MAGADVSWSRRTDSHKTGEHWCSLSLPSSSGSVQDRTHGMKSPTCREAFPVSINHLESLPQTYPKICLLGDYRSCQVAININHHSCHKKKNKNKYQKQAPETTEMLPKALKAERPRAGHQQAWSLRLWPWLTGDLLFTVSPHVFPLWLTPNSYKNIIHTELGHILLGLILSRL